MAVTPTPTPTETNVLCLDVTGDITTQQSTPSATPTLTPTPSYVASRDLPVEDIVGFIIDSGYFECNSVFKVEDCEGGSIYYVPTPINYNGSGLTTNQVIRCLINGVSKCVTIKEEINGSSTHNLTNVSNVYTQCEDCVVTPTPTMTSTNTPTPTPTITPSNTPPPMGKIYVYTGCGTNQMIIQNSIVSGVLPTEVIRYNGDCWYYVGAFNQPYFPPNGFIVSEYNYNYFGVINSNNIYNSCTSCENLPLT